MEALQFLFLYQKRFLYVEKMKEADNGNDPCTKKIYKFYNHIDYALPLKDHKHPPKKMRKLI